MQEVMHSETEILHLMAGIMIIIVGMAALAMPIWRNFKEPPGSDKDHFKFRHVLVGVMTIVLGGMIAANKIQEVIDMARRFGALIAGGT